jgi:CubicO group peptidase (beta-lactamase class C family)
VAVSVRGHPAPGTVAAVVVGNDLVWSRGEGFADLETAEVPDADTPFRIASITKTFTATAIAQLHEAGSLSFDDPIVRFLPELKAARDPFGPIEDLTVRRVLMHRSGLTAEPPLLDWTTRRFPSVEDTLASADRIEVVIPPGSADKYSNLGFQLLGEVVARASGTPFRTFVSERLLGPLSLEGTAFDRPQGAATGYDREPYTDMPTVSGGRTKPTDAEGGLWSTATDLGRWLSFQLEGDPEILRSETLSELHRPAVVLGDAWTGGRGLAWSHERRGERVFIGHAGGTQGSRLGWCSSRPIGSGWSCSRTAPPT